MPAWAEYKPYTTLSESYSSESVGNEDNCDQNKVYGPDASEKLRHVQINEHAHACLTSTVHHHK